MLDYWKLYISDGLQIDKILKNEKIDKDYTYNEDGVLIYIRGKYKNWKLKTLNSGKLEISGSIHRYWNRGTNENDFSFLNAIEAIQLFCKDLELDPSLAHVINLEFGVNLQLSIDASDIISQILCFNNLQPIRPYENRPDCSFIEFEQWDYYLKIYDKGKQFRGVLPQTPNTLRLEIKAMNSRFLSGLGIKTLVDLQQPAKLEVLGLKFAKLLKGLVFDDDTINLKEIPVKDRKLYKELSNPRKWKRYRGNTNSTIRNSQNRFKRIVEENGARKIYSYLTQYVNEKIIHLSKNEKLAVFLPNTYTWKNDKKKVCLSCGKDITQQHKNSLYCSAKYVGYREAHKCRNSNSNPRNNLKKKIEKIISKGVLFDIGPYLVLKGMGANRHSLICRP